jgi:hypothetical protein
MVGKINSKKNWLKKKQATKKIAHKKNNQQKK